MSIFKEDECFNQLETKIPNFHNKILQLILEDIQCFTEPTPEQRGGGTPIILHYLISCLYKDYNVVSDSNSNEEKSILHVARFLRLLRSNKEVWPTLMRELVISLVGFVYLKGVGFLEENCLSIANVTANRSIAEFILSSPDRRNTTADTLKRMIVYTHQRIDAATPVDYHDSIVNDFDDSKELELAILNILTCFTGHLDHWETQFRKHGLPGGGPSEHYFASLVDVTDFSHVEARITRMIISRNAPSDLLH
jgi:hypothetical protein